MRIWRWRDQGSKLLYSALADSPLWFRVAITMEFDEWCEATDEVVNGHDLKVLSGSDDHLVDAQDKVAAIVPAHYASEEHVAHVLERLGKAAAAECVKNCPRVKLFALVISVKFLQPSTSPKARRTKCL